MTSGALASQLEFLSGRLRYGCGCVRCRIHLPEGMLAYDNCNCFPSKFAKQLLGLALECEEMGHEFEKSKEAA